MNFIWPSHSYKYIYIYIYIPSKGINLKELNHKYLLFPFSLLTHSF
jgi:hypothetical protein